VKITVIATGFRDQMPERRARMLSIGDVRVVEEPVVSVPVIAPGNWMNEPAVPVVAKANTPAPFLSEVEDDGTVEAAQSDEPVFFASSAPAVAGKASAAAKAREGEVIREPEFDNPFGSGFDSGFGAGEPELVAAAARPQFAEMSEEPSYSPLPRDYASDFAGGVRGMEAEEHRAQPVTALFPETDEASQRDLDTPAFLRRSRF
jgi:cell division protein FtsZ